MPGLSVIALIDAAERMKPPIPVLLMSGSKPDSRIKSLVDAGRVGFLEKPFDWEEMLRGVRSILGA